VSNKKKSSSSLPSQTHGRVKSKKAESTIVNEHLLTNTTKKLAFLCGHYLDDTKNKLLHQASTHINTLTNHLFRHEAGKMVAVLTKIFGTQNLETAEDVVQQTFIDALSVWKLKGIPDNPSAWLFRVAKNKTIDIIRRNKHSVQYDFSDHERSLFASEYTLATTMENVWKEESIKDDMLRMMYACCHPQIASENQITLILKTLCGFSTSEIAKAFLTSEDTVSKRLYRTKEFFRQQKIKLEIPNEGAIESRNAAVLNSIYLLFNEGYNSTNSDDLIRLDLISEAMLLCKILTESIYTRQPETFALMALMCFHSARSPSRLTQEGEIILLPNQDRSKWNQDFIAEGNNYMNKAAFGNKLSAYHIEAAIAYEHCIAASFDTTNWHKILELYDWLCHVAPSDIAEMNRAVVVLTLSGTQEAMSALDRISNKQKLETYYLYHSLIGEIFALQNEHKKAIMHFEKAINLTKSVSEKKLLQEKMKAILL
jgi:RNA polymerase sigma factor (sigma-70 family)